MKQNLRSTGNLIAFVFNIGFARFSQETILCQQSLHLGKGR